MRSLLLLLGLALLLGPLRCPFFRHARFTVPATLGAILGLALAGYVVSQAGLPPALGGLVALLIVGAFALNAGKACKEWVDETFGEKRQ